MFSSFIKAIKSFFSPWPTYSQFVEFVKAQPAGKIIEHVNPNRNCRNGFATCAIGEFCKGDGHLAEKFYEENTDKEVIRDLAIIPTAQRLYPTYGELAKAV